MRPEQGNLLRGIVNWSGATWSVNSFSDTFYFIWIWNETHFFVKKWVSIQKIVFGENYTYSQAFLRRPQKFEQSASWFGHLQVQVNA
jgi:hypothetical protein